MRTCFSRIPGKTFTNTALAAPGSCPIPQLPVGPQAADLCSAGASNEKSASRVPRARSLSAQRPRTVRL